MLKEKDVGEDGRSEEWTGLWIRRMEARLLEECAVRGVGEREG